MMRIEIVVKGEHITTAKELDGEISFKECCLLLGQMKIIEQELIDLLSDAFEPEYEITPLDGR